MDDPLALHYFRNMASLLYREIGVLSPEIHPGVAAKARLDSEFFPTKRKELAYQAYQQTATETHLIAILTPYMTLTGLALEDLRRAFDEGNWIQGGYISYGGPKWAKIAEVTISLRDAIASEDREEALALVEIARNLKHNTGSLVDKFYEPPR